MPPSRKLPEPPPPVLACARVLHYAVVDSVVRFAGRTLLFVDGKELSQVPRLVICEERERSEALLFHCTADWDILGCSAHKSVAKAKAHAETIYHGVATRWVDADVSEQTADAYLDELFGARRCNVCDRRADKVNRLIQNDSGAWVCDECAG